MLLTVLQQNLQASSAQISWVEVRPGAFSLAADPGFFSVSGQSANLVAGRKLLAGPGAFTLTGLDAALVVGSSGPNAQISWVQVAPPARVLVADTGVFTFTGNAAGMSYGSGVAQAQVSWLEVSAGAAPVQAQVSWLQVSPPSTSTYVLTAETGVFIVQVAPSLSDYVLTAETGVFIVQVAPSLSDYVLTAETGVFSLYGGGAWGPAAASSDPALYLTRIGTALRTALVPVSSGVVVPQETRRASPPAQSRLIVPYP